MNMYYLLIEAILRWIYIDVVVWTKFEGEFTLMICCHFNGSSDGLSFGIFSDNCSCRVMVWSFVHTRVSIPSISADSAFTIIYRVLMIKPSTKPFVVIVVRRSVEAVSPGCWSWRRLGKPGVSRYQKCLHWIIKYRLIRFTE